MRDLLQMILVVCLCFGIVSIGLKVLPPPQNIEWALPYYVVLFLVALQVSCVVTERLSEHFFFSA
jgi:hypothetical protein